MKRYIWNILITVILLYNVDSALGKQGTGCECVKYDCGCCVHIDVEKIKLNDTGCVNISYLPEQYGISLTFTIDKVVIINKTVSAKNPPPICFGVPHLEKEAGLCIDFYDLDYSHKTFSGCIQLEAVLYHTTVAKIKVGCFKIPLARYGVNADKHMQELIQEAKIKKEERKKKYNIENVVLNILP